MIIDILNNLPMDERTRIVNAAEKLCVFEYYSPSSDGVDLYKLYPDAPYWGHGVCEHGDCKDCKEITEYHGDEKIVFYNHYDPETDERCEHYSDKKYMEWMDAHAPSAEERELVEKIETITENQIKLFIDDPEWTRLMPSKLSLDFFNWLNERNITYCLIKGLLHEDHLFIKAKEIPSDYYVIFTNNPTMKQLNEAVDFYKWVCYDLEDLINKSHTFNEEEVIFRWLYDNSIGCFHTVPLTIEEDFGPDPSPFRTLGGARTQKKISRIYFEQDVDAMALKLRWADYEV